MKRTGVSKDEGAKDRSFGDEDAKDGVPQMRVPDEGVNREFHRVPKTGFHS